MRAAVVTGLTLAALYLATLAPDVALWDAGEFSAAAASYGIPHPPGTPLYVTVARAWDALLPGVSPAIATNLLSAVTTALAFALLAALVARWMGAARYGVAAAVCAGAFASVWRIAVEAEVYGPALLLAMATLHAGDRAGAEPDARVRRRWLALVAYLIVLAVPLHLTSLLAAPAAIVLAVWIDPPGRASHATGRIDARAALLLGGTLMATVGVARLSAVLAGIGFALVVVGGLAMGRPAENGNASDPAARRTSAPRRAAVLVAAAMVIAASALVVIPARARHDPPLNQGNGATVVAAAAIVVREQYQAAGLWPRQAPPWLQIGNLFEWADWQVAGALGPGPQPTLGRTTVTLLFAALGGFGAVAHLRRDRRSFGALLLLLVCGGPGAVAYLNLRAGPSFGVGVLPDDAPHEARERDYFFLLGFTAWGAWAGVGAMALRDRTSRRAFRAAWLAVPAVPIVANAPVVWRSDADAAVAGDLATLLLESAPPRAVLLARGDNDTYPLWYQQIAEERRPDVVVVPVALLPSEWYRAELRRRHGLEAGAVWRGTSTALLTLAHSATAGGRVVAQTPMMPRALWPEAGARWRWHGLVRVRTSPGARDARSPEVSTEPAIAPTTVSSAAALEIEWRLRRQGAASDARASLAGDPLRPTVDATARQLRKLLLCAGLETGRWRPPPGAPLLAPGCVPP